MLKQRPIVYLVLVVAFGGLVLAGVSVDRVLFIGFFVFMLMMHMGHGHSGHGQGGHEEHGTQQDPVRQEHVASAPKEDDEVAGK